MLFPLIVTLNLFQDDVFVVQDDVSICRQKLPIYYTTRQKLPGFFCRPCPSYFQKPYKTRLSILWHSTCM
jgi:hypothetical protein